MMRPRINRRRPQPRKTFSEFEKFICGRSVVFVGPAPILLGKRLGKEIDSFDVVVKTLGAVYVEKENYGLDYGFRSDVLYINSQLSRFVSPSKKLLQDRGVKFLRSKNRLWSIEGVNADFIPAHIQRSQEVNRATMGSIAILDILSCSPKSLHLTGVDFYTSRIYPKNRWTKRPLTEYVDQSYIPQEFINRVYPNGYPEKIGGEEDKHDHLSNALFIDRLFKAGKISMPDFVQEAMHQAIELGNSEKV